MTLTLATGAGVTVKGALPLFPSLVAVIVAEPGATAVITPVAELTVATVGASELQAITRPVRTPPLPSEVTALACEVPTAVIELGASDTDTVATGTGITPTADVPLCPSLVAVIVVFPTARAVTRPLADTDATPGALEIQLTTRPVSVPPFASRRVTVSC